MFLYLQPQAPDAGDSVLDRFTNDLTVAARRGELDPMVGRDPELRRVVHILLRRTKNNPVLVGEPGAPGWQHNSRFEIRATQVLHSSCSTAAERKQHEELFSLVVTGPPAASPALAGSAACIHSVPDFVLCNNSRKPGM